MEQQSISPKLKPLIWAVSIIVPLLVGGLLSAREPFVQFDFNTYIFPKINAGINSVVTLLLLVGLYLIKKKRIDLHKKVMLTAFGLSALFLVSYVLYHISTPHTAYCEDGPVPKALYLFILITHIGLSIFIVPLASFSIFHGLSLSVAKHRKLVRFSFPIWLYVSLTGVLVYLMISPCYGG